MAHKLLRHLRNAMAHGNITNENRQFFVRVIENKKANNARQDL